jgi:hypothetical protein
MTKKIAIFAFNGEPMCFFHALMNAMGMRKSGYEVKLIIEGSATKLIKDFEGEGPLAEMFRQVRELGLLDCACNACSVKMGTQESALSLEIPLCSEMMGHPSMARYIEDGFDIITL